MLDHGIGVKHTDTACRAKENDQVALVQEMRKNYRAYVEDGRLNELLRLDR